jgi:hypothetical protein
MTRADRTLCIVYGLIALAALVGTQWVLADYLAGSGSLGDFLDATVTGNAATFLSIDLLAVATAATVFMVVDGRRTGVRRLWVYVVLVFAVAISVAFPLYLIARTRTLAAASTGV